MDTLLDGICDTSELQDHINQVVGKVETRQQLHREAHFKLQASLLEFLQDSKVHWRSATMAANILMLHLRPELPAGPDMASMALQIANSELPSMRGIGNSMLRYILHHTKHLAFAKGDVDAVAVGNVQHPLKRTIQTPENHAELSEKLIQSSRDTLSPESVAAV